MTGGPATPGSLRRGLPRVPGGEAWPPASVEDTAPSRMPNVSVAATHHSAEATTSSIVSIATPGAADADTSAVSHSEASAASSPEIKSGERATGVALATAPEMRRGLPRTHGGDPWPAVGYPASVGFASSTAGATTDITAPDVAAKSAQITNDAPASAAAGATAALAAEIREQPVSHAATASNATSQTAAAAAISAQSETALAVNATDPGAKADSGAKAAGTVALRRGLPRTKAGEPWPPGGFAVDRWAYLEAVQDASGSDSPEGAPPEVAAATSTSSTPGIAGSAAGAKSAAKARGAERRPKADRREREEPPAKTETRRLLGVHIPILVGGAVVLVLLAGLAVLAARWFVDQPFGRDFLADFPGETHLPENTPVGIPVWLAWQHFFNVFLIVLIIRSGLQVRTEKRPSAFWTPRWNSKRKISLALWFHQALDILWFANGVIFVFLLAVTGMWLRVTPTSWEIFPNAISAGIQYVSLDWPTENGWVNYNSLQVLAYFVTIYIAAPLAAITGVRMSGLWPKSATRLNRIYPVEWARALHYPVMLYFCLFIVVHVTLVFATGALRNLNHMYAAQGSTDPNAYAGNWLGFVIFTVSMLVIAGGWLAARPLVLAPIANLFGQVKGR